MNKQQIITANVTNKVDILIKSTNNKAPLNKPLYAINWFSTKIEWLYHFYNLVATKSVLNVGGRAFFKGNLIENLYGDSKDAHEILLIVSYPSANSFKELMENTYFKIISIFRVISVKKFTFGFSSKLFPLKKKSTRDKSKKYAIHHVRTNAFGENNVSQIQALLNTSDVRLHFVGEISALLYSKKNNGNEHQIPCLMNGLFLLESDTNEALISLFKEEKYQAFMKSFEGSFVGMIKRTL